MNMGGEHNVENVIVSVAVVMELGIETLKIKEAVATFSGVKRRFEYIIKTADQVMIDDYAHHPEELRGLISSTKELFPGKKCTVVFQPHLFSRTKDLAEEFGEVLSLADEVILLPIYPARELPMEGVTSQLILDNVTIEGKSILQKDELLNWVMVNKPDLLVTSGAGDIDTLVKPLKEILTK
jgi:UDP-N-acetylmuramate--alanine ligase